MRHNNTVWFCKIKFLSSLTILTILSVDCTILTPDKSVHRKCLTEIIQKYFNNLHHLAIFIDSDVGEDILQQFSTKILYAPSTQSDFILEKADGYFLELEETKIVDVLKKLSSISTWNPRAKFLVISKDKSKIFEEASKYFINNLFVFENLKDNLDSFYTWENNNVCGPNNIKINTCTTLISFKKSRFWKTCNLQVLAMPMAPYVYFNENKNLDGLEIRCLNALQQKMGFQVKYLPLQDKTWGLKYPNGTYTDMFKKLQNYQADIVLGMWPNNFTHMWDFDVTVNYLQDALIWLVPKAQTIPYWKRLTIIFPENVWIILLFLLLLLPIVWTVAARILSELELSTYQTWVSSILKSISILLTVTLPIYPKTGCIRILFIFWVYISLIIVTIYQSKLLAILVQPQYEKQIQTEGELLKSGLKFGANVNVRSLYDPAIQNEKEFYDRIILCDLTLSCPNRTAHRRDFATAKSRLPALFLILQQYTNPDGSPMIYMFKSPISTHFISVVFSRGHPIFEDFNKRLLWVVEGGLSEKWKNDIKDETRRKYLFGKIGLKKSMVLTLEHVGAGFKILIVGLALSALVFCLEHAYVKIIKKIK